MKPNPKNVKLEDLIPGRCSYAALIAGARTINHLAAELGSGAISLGPNLHVLSVLDTRVLPRTGEACDLSVQQPTSRHLRADPSRYFMVLAVSSAETRGTAPWEKAILLHRFLHMNRVRTSEWYLIKGVRSGCDFKAKSWGAVDTCRRCERFEDRELYEAPLLASAIERAFCQLSNYLQIRNEVRCSRRPHPFYRLIRSYDAWERGMHEFDAAERIHQFVRVFDGVIPETRDVGEQMRRRLTRFFRMTQSPDPNAKRLRFCPRSGEQPVELDAMDSLIDCLRILRNKIEHLSSLNNVLPDLDEINTENSAIEPLAARAELMASWLLGTILSRDDLWKSYRTPESTSELFSKIAKDEIDPPLPDPFELTPVPLGSSRKGEQ